MRTVFIYFLRGLDERVGISVVNKHHLKQWIEQQNNDTLTDATSLMKSPIDFIVRQSLIKW